MNIKKAALSLIMRFKLQITLLLIAVIAVTTLIVWAGRTIETSSLEIVSDNNIDITPQQIQSIKAIGQWEFLAVND